jgi:putative flippase GtrA
VPRKLELKNLLRKIEDKKIRKEIIHFCICGVLSALLYFTILYIFNNLIMFNSILSVSIAYMISSIFNFFYNRRLTFLNKRSISRQFFSFLLMLAVSYFVTISIIYTFKIFFNFNVYLSSIFAILINTIFKFLFSKSFVY